MMLLKVTDRYNFIEAFIFDFFVAPAVLGELLPFRDMVAGSMGEGSRVLDVGCGGGQLAIEMAKAGKSWKVAGVDLCRSQLERAGRRALDAGVDMEFVRASALEMPFPDACFDLVYSVDCIKHWPDREKGLKECMRVLRPGGMLFLTEVSRDCTLRKGLKFVQGWRVPKLLRPFSVIPLFIFAVLRSITVDEACSMASRLRLNDAVVDPDFAGINWAIRGTKA